MDLPRPGQVQPLFRDAMAHLVAAVNIVTTDGPGGRAGFSATAICSVTDSPPTLLVCLNRNASAYHAMVQNKVFCVNTLGPAHQDLAQLFGGKTPQDERFIRASWSTLSTCSPVLDDALISFDCKLVNKLESGTHDIMVGAIEHIRLGEARDGLIYFGRRYHGLPAA